MRKKTRAREKERAKRQFLLLLAASVLGLLTAGILKVTRWSNVDTLWGFVSGWLTIIAGAAFLWVQVPEEGKIRQKLILLGGFLFCTAICVYMGWEALLPLEAWAKGVLNLDGFNPWQVRIVLNSWYRALYIIVGIVYAFTAYGFLRLLTSDKEPEVVRRYMWFEPSEY